jgi:hypothetical protein
MAKALKLPVEALAEQRRARIERSLTPTRLAITIWQIEILAALPGRA